MSEFTKNISPMAIAEDFIKETDSYQELISKGNKEYQAINMCLEGLGMDMSNITLNKGIIRTHQNKRQGYVGNVYIGMTRPDFEKKYLYDYIEVLAPNEVPAGKDIVDLESLGDEYSEDQQPVEQLKAELVEDRKRENKRQVRTPKYKPQ